MISSSVLNWMRIGLALTGLAARFAVTTAAGVELAGADRAPDGTEGSLGWLISAAVRGSAMFALRFG